MYASLLDSNSAEIIREATLSEAVASLEAGPEGHIRVDGTLCYVQGIDADDEIQQLRAEAAAAGDLEMVSACDNALAGDEEALTACLRAIMDGQG